LDVKDSSVWKGKRGGKQQERNPSERGKKALQQRSLGHIEKKKRGRDRCWGRKSGHRLLSVDLKGKGERTGRHGRASRDEGRPTGKKKSLSKEGGRKSMSGNPGGEELREAR